jgi:hypothetical protein
MEYNQIWDYCEDWNQTYTLELTTMPEHEVNALPEFDGF